MELESQKMSAYAARKFFFQRFYSLACFGRYGKHLKARGAVNTLPAAEIPCVALVKYNNRLYFAIHGNCRKAVYYVFVGCRVFKGGNYKKLIDFSEVINDDDLKSISQTIDDKEVKMEVAVGDKVIYSKYFSFDIYIFYFI